MRLKNSQHSKQDIVDPAQLLCKLKHALDYYRSTHEYCFNSTPGLFVNWLRWCNATGVKRYYVCEQIMNDVDTNKTVDMVRLYALVLAVLKSSSKDLKSMIVTQLFRGEYGTLNHGPGGILKTVNTLSSDVFSTAWVNKNKDAMKRTTNHAAHGMFYDDLFNKPLAITTAFKECVTQMKLSTQYDRYVAEIQRSFDTGSPVLVSDMELFTEADADTDRGSDMSLFTDTDTRTDLVGGVQMNEVCLWVKNRQLKQKVNL